MVAKSGKTTWKVRFRDGSTDASETFVTEKAAKNFCKLVDALGGSRARQTINTYNSSTVITHTLGEVVDKWFAWKSARRADGTPLRVGAPYTLTRYEQLIRLHIKPRLGHLQVNLVTERDVQEWVDGIGSKVSPKVTADAHALLHQVYGWANKKAQSLAIIDPCTETVLPKKRKHVVKGIRLDEWALIYRAALEVDQNAADLLLFLAASGWRWSEAVAVTSADVDDYGDRISVNMGRILRRTGNSFEFVDDEAKSQAGIRRIDMPPGVAEMIRRRRLGALPDDLIFQTRTGRPWRYSSFHSDIWTHSRLSRDTERTRRRILQLAGDKGLKRAPDIELHMLRHLHSVFFLDYGEPMTAVQKRLGHEDIRTTVGVYGTMAADVSPAALKALDRALLGGAAVSDIGQQALDG